MWTIYIHTNKINGKVYIGQTHQKLQERWRNGEGYKTHNYFYNAIKKYGWDNGFTHNVLEDNIKTKEEADQREQYWIAKYNATNPDYGYNILKGGEGFSSEQAREYSLKNWNNSYFKKKWCKAVICLNTQQIYESIAEASRQTGVDKASIGRCCNNKVLSAGKDEQNNPLLWSFYEEGKKYIYKPLTTKDWQQSSAVICTTTMEIFNTIQEAANKYNISYSCISNCCTHQSRTAGHLSDGTRLCWEYYYPDATYIQTTDSGSATKKVKCITTNKIFNSLKEAGAFYNIAPSNISNCCRGKNKTAGKYNGKRLTWEYYLGDKKENE